MVGHNRRGKKPNQTERAHRTNNSLRVKNCVLSTIERSSDVSLEVTL